MARRHRQLGEAEQNVPYFVLFSLLHDLRPQWQRCVRCACRTKVTVRISLRYELKRGPSIRQVW